VTSNPVVQSEPQALLDRTIATDAATSSVITIAVSKAIVRLIRFSFFSGNPCIAFSGLRPFAYG
jgi:hypothetical protein